MNEITTKQKTSITEKSLIDFLYVDETRVDSLISQLRDGTPRSVVKMVEDSTIVARLSRPKSMNF